VTTPAAPTARDLFAHIFGDRRDYLAIFSGLRRHGSDRLELPHTSYFRYPDELDAAEAHIAKQVSLNRDVYFCAHLLTAKQRTKEYASSVLALWADVDTADLNASPMRPTAIVETSPGRFQAYARLTDPVAPHYAETLNRRWALAFGADRSGYDLTQLLRVPGTPNRKYPDFPTVRLAQIDGRNGDV
jgi:hypothetical protein